MNDVVKEIRDLNLELESLKARKEAIKQKLIEHRSAIKKSMDNKTNYESNTFDVDKQESRDLEKQINEKEKELERAQERAKNEERGEIINMNNDVLHFNDKMTRAEIAQTVEYRSAFFKRLQGKDLNEEEVRSMTSATGSAGAAIPTKTMDMILGQLSENSVLLNDVTVFNIPELISIPKENVVNDASWVAEDSDSTVSDDTLTNISLSAYKLIRTIKITAKVSAMTIDAFEAWIVSTMTKKMTKAIEAAIVNGSGSNQPKGLMTGITWDESNSIEVLAGGTFSYDNFVDAESLIDEDYVGNAVYYMNRKTLAAVRKLKDDTKRPLFERAVEDGFRGYLNGIAVKLSRNIPDNTIFVGDLKTAYVLNFSAPIEFATSKEAGFMSGATVYRSLALVDGKPTGVANSIVKLSIAEA